MVITSESRVGEVAAQHPLATRVFARHGIDFCCSGGKPLAEACSASGATVTDVIGELEREIAGHTDGGIRWDEQPVAALIEHILTAFHEPLREELPRIEEMMRKVHRVHGARDQARFDALLEKVLAIRADIEGHLPKEEQMLFPQILAGRGAMMAMPITVMEEEHEVLGGLLRDVRSLTNDFTLPDDACNTWRALWAALEELERSLHEHIHLENNVLHKKAHG